MGTSTCYLLLGTYGRGWIDSFKGMEHTPTDLPFVDSMDYLGYSSLFCCLSWCVVNLLPAGRFVRGRKRFLSKFGRCDLYVHRNGIAFFLDNGINPDRNGIANIWDEFGVLFWPL